jgi:hypothetical protein
MERKILGACMLGCLFSLSPPLVSDPLHSILPGQHPIPCGPSQS